MYVSSLEVGMTSGLSEDTNGRGLYIPMKAGRISWLLGKLLTKSASRYQPIVTCQTKHGPIRFYCPSSMAEYRARTLLTKEPETIEWIDGFRPAEPFDARRFVDNDVGDVFWDIGASVGVYSLYAARRRVRTYAFEPSAVNYYLLNRNIALNKPIDLRAFSIAFDQRTSIGQLNLSSTEPGAAFNSFNEMERRAMSQGDPSKTAPIKAATESVLGFTIDAFIAEFRPEFPNHMKIDVDGTESRIIAGAIQTLRNEQLRSILIEMDEAKPGTVLTPAAEQPDRNDYVFRVMRASGFELIWKRHAKECEGTPYETTYNFLFERK